MHDKLSGQSHGVVDEEEILLSIEKNIEDIAKEKFLVSPLADSQNWRTEGPVPEEQNPKSQPKSDLYTLVSNSW